MKRWREQYRGGRSRQEGRREWYKAEVEERSVKDGWGRERRGHREQRVESRKNGYS